VTKGEECDDGNSVDGDGCDSNCTKSSCGNGIVGGKEECDDGNLIDGDGCDSNCTSTRCGNGIVTTGEECDDGNADNGDQCDRNCTKPRCGNGALDPGEECDDGNTVDGDGCDHNCTATRCGNGVVTTGEVCDDGNNKNGDGCDNDCRPTGAPRPDGPASTGGDRVLAGALTFGGSILMVGGTVLAIAGGGPLVDHLQISLKIAEAEKKAKTDPDNSLTSARQLQVQDADANQRWQSGGIEMVAGGALSLLVGGVGAAAGWLLWNSPSETHDPSREERIP
jgi:cysteine-rich repeat protein